jgi:ABC-type sugar transport system ATPase subunit
MDVRDGDAAPLVRVEHLVKRYPGVQALKGVSVTVRKGAIHGLLGENGAGKSTLVSIIAGLQAPTSGAVSLDGRPVTGADVQAMEERGLFLVPQEPMIIPQLSAAENLALGRWPLRGGFLIDTRRMMADARKALADTGIRPLTEAGQLSAVDKRKLNILRVLFSGARCIILDEPTAALTVADREQLFDFMRELRDGGVTFLFISHYNEEILEICDALTVLRDGEVAASVAGLDGITSEQLSQWITGRGLDLYKRDNVSTEAADDGDWIIRGLRCGSLSVPELTLRKGEIMGFAGLPGSGAKELGKTLFGLSPASEGTLAHKAAEHRLPRRPSEALEHRIAYLSDDRRKEGIIDLFSIADNITLSSLGSLSRFGMLDLGRGTRTAEDLARRLRIKAESVRSEAGHLCGGNQQKVCLGRVIATGPDLLIIVEPSRGIDVGAKEEVYRIIDQLAGGGMSVVVISSDLDELMRTVDRICLFAGGRIVAVRERAHVTKDELLEIAFSAGAPP